MREFVKNILKEAYYVPIILSLFFVPLFFHPSFISSFVQGKEIVFKLIMVVTMLSLVPFLLYKKQFRIRNIFYSRIFVLLLLQLVIYAVSDFVSATPFVSFYGTFSRGFGFIIELFLFFLLLYCVLVLSKEKIINLLKVVFITGVLVAFYAFLQMIDFDFFFYNFDSNIFDGRAFSFLGNPSYLGQFMLVTIILACPFLITTHGYKKFIVMLGVLLMVLALFFSGTRTALLALMVAIFLLSIKYFPLLLGVCKKHVFKVLLIVSGVALIFLVVPSERYSLSDVALRSLNSRIEIWKGAVELIKEKPVLGYGGEAFYVYFPEIVTTKFLMLEEDINVSADRIHNEILEILFAHGIFAVIVYFLLFMVILGIFFRSKDYIIVFLALSYVANIIQNQFAFPDISISVLVTFVLSSLIVFQVDEVKKNLKFNVGMYLRTILAVCILAVGLFVGFVTVFKPYMAQLAYAMSQENYSVSYDIAVNKHKEALSYTPYYSELWYELMFIDSSSMARALLNLERIDGDSGNVLAWKGNFYADNDAQKASEYYVMAIEKNPYHPNWIRAFADMLYKQGDYENALFMYDRYLEAVPGFWKWANNLEDRSLREQKSYETFMKHTPYFWEIVEKRDKIYYILDLKNSGESG